MLRKSYRSRPVHCLWSSRKFYGGLLDSGIHQDDDKVASFQAWAQKTFTAINDPVERRIAIDVGNDSRSIDFSGTVSVWNPYEAAIVIRAAASMIISSANLTCGKITAAHMILTPYTGQAMLLEQFAAAQGNLVDGIRICTVTQAQGGEAAVVMLSTVMTANPLNPFSAAFIGDASRLNVAMTRQRVAMLVFGTWGGWMNMRNRLAALSETKTFGNLVADFHTKGRVHWAPTRLLPFGETFPQYAASDPDRPWRTLIAPQSRPRQTAPGSSHPSASTPRPPPPPQTQSGSAHAPASRPPRKPAAKNTPAHAPAAVAKPSGAALKLPVHSSLAPAAPTSDHVSIMADKITRMGSELTALKGQLGGAQDKVVEFEGLQVKVKKARDFAEVQARALTEMEAQHDVALKEKDDKIASLTTELATVIICQWQMPQ